MKMAITKDYYIGQVRITIDDTYCKDKTEEDTKRALDNIAMGAYPHLLRKYMREMEREAQTGNEKEGGEKK